MSNICRTCMSKGENMISIFDQGKSPPITDMIMAISAVEFLPTDSLPQQMCIPCCETLEISYYFKNQVIRNNNALHEQAQTSKLLALQVHEEGDEIGRENEDVYKDHIEISTENINFKANPPFKCPDSLASSHTYDPSVENDMKSLNLEIPLSGKLHGDDYTHFDEICIKAEEADENSGQSEDNCKITQQIMIKNKTYDDAFSSEDDLPLTLLHAGTGSYNKYQAIQQISNKKDEVTRKVSKGDAPFKCTDCRKLFHRESTFISHFNENKCRNKCTICEKTFTWHRDLVSHMRRHTGETPFKCQHCNLSFKHMRDLKIHTRLHTGETRPNPYTCEECGKSFGKPCRLKEHMRTHTGERPFECQFCKARFKHTSNLNKHVRLHADQIKPKPYMCEVCGNAFDWPSNLMEHMRIHTGERPFKCQFCTASFTHRTSLNKHISRHTGEARPKPHICEVCGKTFTSAWYLKQHMLCHTVDRPFRCQDCNAGFKRLSHLNRHIRLHTGEAEILDVQTLQDDVRKTAPHDHN